MTSITLFDHRVNTDLTENIRSTLSSLKGATALSENSGHAEFTLIELLKEHFKYLLFSEEIRRQ